MYNINATCLCQEKSLYIAMLIKEKVMHFFSFDEIENAVLMQTEIRFYGEKGQQMSASKKPGATEHVKSS